MVLQASAAYRPVCYNNPVRPLGTAIRKYTRVKGVRIMRRVFEILFVVILIIVAFFTFRPQPPFPDVAGTDAVVSLLQVFPGK